MPDLTLGNVEERFADIIWENEPLSSSELARKSEAVLCWKKSTSFTVLKRLCNKGIFKNENGQVTSLMSKEEFLSRQSEQFVEETFRGSLPAFFAAFTARKPLTKKEAEELRVMIARYAEKGEEEDE